MSSDVQQKWMNGMTSASDVSRQLLLQIILDGLDIMPRRLLNLFDPLRLRRVELRDKAAQVSLLVARESAARR